MTTEARAICSKFFDDLSVGECFETYGRTVTEFDVVGFGAITGDTNPQHLDKTFGSQGRFGERVAHGALVVSFALGLVPIDPARLIALRRLSDVVFKRPVKIGDSIRVQGEIANCSPISGGTGLVVLSARVVNQDEQAVARMKIETLWQRSSDLSTPKQPPVAAAQRRPEAFKELACPPL